MTNVAGIKCGNTDLALTVRVIHLWSVPDRTNPAVDGSLHMLLLDEKVLSLWSSGLWWLNLMINIRYSMHVI